MEAGKAFRTDQGTLTIHRPASRVVLVSLAGTDVGQFGDAPFVELRPDVKEDGQLELYIDARSGVTASLDVSGEWALWLKEHKASFKRVNMLTGSRFIHMSAGFVRSFADLGEVMRIYTDAGAFEEALSASIAGGHPG
jgi:hypothetical protein